MNANDFLQNETHDEKALHRFYRAGTKNPLVSVAWVTVFVVTLMALFGPLLAPYDPIKTDLSYRLASPSLEYPLGNDALGRCLLSRIVCGARMSIGLGVFAVIFSCLFGVIVGLISGYQGGLLDEVLMRIVDIFFSFPEIVMAMAIAGLMGPGTLNLLFALSFVSWMRYARVVRGITLSVKERDYVKAAQLSGVSKIAIIFRHVFPASMSSVIVIATIGLAKAVLAISALGFLGFGVQPPFPEWGTLLMEGKDYILTAPHLSLFPGIALSFSVLAFNLLGDSLRDTWAADLDRSGR
jgi:peptide/nickel transport system permease protein